MASSPFYTRPTGQLSPAAGPQTAYFGHLERSNSTGSAWSLSPTDAIAQNGAPEDAGRLMSRSPVGAAAAAGLSPSSSYAGLDPTRSYSPMERSMSNSLLESNSSNIGTIGQGRKLSSSAGGGGGVGAIGEGRRTATPAAERREDEASFLGLSTGYFNPDGSFAAPFHQNSGGANGSGGSSEHGAGATKSRPSSFILDVLPQARERGAGGGVGSSGPPTPSLSLDSASQPPAMSATASEMFPLPSPHSLAPSSYLTTASQSPFGSLPQSPGGHLFASSSSRTSSPGPIDSTPGPSSGISPVEALANKVQTLESNVSTLSNVLATEFRSLREELGVLRALVQQQQQQQQPAGTHSNGASDHTERGNSPVLTLRSPSPHSTTGRPPQNLSLNRNPLNSSFNGSMSSLHVQPATSPGAISPGSSVASGFFASQQEGREELADSSNLKDEQIKLLTAQVNSLTTTVSTLLGSPALSSNGFAGIAGSPSSPMIGGSASPSSALPQQVPARGMTMPLGSPALGLGVPSVGSGLGGGARAPPPMMRTASGTGLGRNSSLRSSINGPGAGTGGGGGSFEGGAPLMSPSPSLNGWTDQQGAGHGPASVAMMPSPSTGSVSGVGSPMLGGGGGGASSNPPGSLGSKWEMLGVGNELFRAVAKFGLGPPTKIQGKAIPSVIRGQDVVAQAPAIQERIQCYVIPALQIIYTHASLAAQLAASEGSQSPPSPGVQVVIITATVDQAAQAQRLSVGLGGALGIRTSLCTGSSHDLQNEAQTLLKAPPHILVGTPQKLVDLFSMRILPTASIRLLAIDECDQLIARNLSEHVIALSRLLPATVTVPVASTVASSPVMGRSGLAHGFDSPFSAPMSRFGSTGGPSSSQGAPSAGPPTMSTIDRQMAIFSCTVPQDVLGFATSLQLKEPVKVLVRRENTDGGASPSMRGLKQYYMYLAVASNPASKSKAPGAGRREASTSREWKLEALADLCEDHSFEHAVVYASSIDSVEAVAYKLGSRNGIEALALHQDMGQSARQQVIAKFRSAAPSRNGQPPKRVLVVYDALSRSLSDVGQVPLLINFDMPRAVEDYVHRLACATGHNKNSMVLNVVTPNEVDMLRNIESFFRCTIRELPANFATASQQ